MTTSIDLGSGENPRNIFGADNVIGVDIFSQESPKVIEHDLNTGTLPFDDNVADYVLAFDLLEHIGRDGYRLSGTTVKTFSLERYNPFLDLMSEIWRVLKAGGKFYAKTPVLPNTNEVFRDPTHVNVFTPDMAHYFTSGHQYSLLGLTQHYGFKGDFRFAEPQKTDGAHIIWHFEAVK